MVIFGLYEFAFDTFAVLALLLGLCVYALFSNGYRTTSTKAGFIGSLLFIMIIVQFYHLLQASLYIPATRFFVYDVMLNKMLAYSIKG
jgi:hypothetical protein